MLTGVSVAAKNVNTGETRQATSNDVGQFAMPNLQVGGLRSKRGKAGFQRKVVDQVTLEVQAVRTIDMMLPPGTVSEQVNVTAGALHCRRPNRRSARCLRPRLSMKSH